ETFPVVGRQWDAVSHFKAQILQKSTLHLKSAKGTDLDVIETVCAIMLLDDVTMKDMFKLLLAQRQAAIRDVLQVKSNTSGDIGQQIVQAIQIFRATLFHVGNVFLPSNQGTSISPLERYLRSLQQTFTSPSPTSSSRAQSSILSHGTSNPLTNTAASVLQPSALAATTATTSSQPSSSSSSSLVSVIPKLYPTTPNIHLLVRYLPESIQNFTPFIHLDDDGKTQQSGGGGGGGGGGGPCSFSQQDAIQGVQRWKDDIVEMFSVMVEKLLQKVTTTSTLVTIRSTVWYELQADEFAVEFGSLSSSSSSRSKNSSSSSSSSNDSPWNTICHRLLSSRNDEQQQQQQHHQGRLSLWKTVLRPVFIRTFQDIIDFSLEGLSMQPQKLLRPRLGELDQDSDLNRDIGKFIWNETTTTCTTTVTTTTVTASGSSTATMGGAHQGGSSSSVAMTPANLALSLPTATEPLIQRIQEYVVGRTDVVAMAIDSFETTLEAIRLDQAPALVYDRETVFGPFLEELSSLSLSSSSSKGRTRGDHSKQHRHGEKDERNTSTTNKKLTAQEEDEDGDEDVGVDVDVDVDLFNAKADAAQLVQYYHKQCIGCIQTYTQELERLVQESVRNLESGESASSSSSPAMDRAMTIGRVASGVGSLGWKIRQALLLFQKPQSSSTTTSSSSSSDISSRRQQHQQQQQQQQYHHGFSPSINKTSVFSSSVFAQERVNKVQVDVQVQELTDGLFNVYLKSHEAWMDHVEHMLKKGMKIYLEQTPWADLAALAWEPMIPSANDVGSSGGGAGIGQKNNVSSNTGGGGGGGAEDGGRQGAEAAAAAGSGSGSAKTLLPFHGSTRLMTALHQVVQEMHRVGTGYMRPEPVRQLTRRLAQTTLETLEMFLKERIHHQSAVVEGQGQDDKGKGKGKGEQEQIAFTEKGALQLLFDIKFLNLVFQSHYHHHHYHHLDGGSGSDTELVRLSKSVADQVRVHKPLGANADRQYSRVSALLGLLVQLNPVESKRKANIVERTPHVFAMAPLTARFTLLPIGQKMTSGRSV
ncbi:Golgi transport complex subunit 1, partial [Podila humilis]